MDRKFSGRVPGGDVSQEAPAGSGAPDEEGRVVDAAPTRRSDPKAVTADDGEEPDEGTGSEDEGHGSPKGMPSTSSLADEIRNKAKRGVADGAAHFGEGMAATASAAAKGVASLPSAARRAMGRVAGSRVGTSAKHMVTSTASALGIQPKAAGALIAILLALVLGTGATLAMGNGGFDPRIWVDSDDCVWQAGDTKEDEQSRGQGENKIPEEYGNGGYTVCVNLDTYSYPGSSTQRIYQDMWKAQGRQVKDGIPVIDGRYMIACTTTYGQMGDKIDFYLSDGTKIPCIMVEVKSQQKTWYDQHPANKWGHDGGQNVIEFQWCNESPYATKRVNPGNAGWTGTEGWAGKRVASWSNVGGGGESDDSVIGGATSGSSSATRKASVNGLSDCAKRAEPAVDNSTAAAAAVSYAYSNRNDQAGRKVNHGNGYDGTQVYLKVWAEVFPGDSYSRSCDRSVGSAIRWSGTDVDFPAGPTGTQISYMEGSDKWQKVGTVSSGDDLDSKCQPGDVLIYDGHVMMYVGHEVIEKVYNSSVKGTDGDLGEPKSTTNVVSGSIGDYTGDDSAGKPSSRAPSLSTGLDSGSTYGVYRCVKPDGSDKYADFDVAGLTTQNQSQVGQCECEVKPRAQSVGEEMAELAVQVSGTGATGEQRTQVPDQFMHPYSNPGPSQTTAWTDKDELESAGVWSTYSTLKQVSMTNQFIVEDATLGNSNSSVGQKLLYKWGGNNAYGSCCQAVAFVVAAAGDPDIGPGGWSAGSGNDAGGSNSVIGADGGGSAGPAATMFYLTARSRGGSASYDTHLWQDLGSGLKESDLKPGDVFVSKTHVAMYVGNKMAQRKFAGTDANVYEAGFGDSVPGVDPSHSIYPGLTHWDDATISQYHVFRLTQRNTRNENYDGKTLDWKSMITDTMGAGYGKGSVSNSGGSVDDSSNGSQQAVVNAAKGTPSPGVGRCAEWVTNVLQSAGVGTVLGNANDMYGAWCHSSDKGELKVGMIIAVNSHPHTSAGQTYGHVGIYIGGGKVMDNVGTIRTVDLDRWIDYYGETNQVRWGWAGGKSLA